MPVENRPDMYSRIMKCRLEKLLQKILQRKKRVPLQLSENDSFHPSFALEESFRLFELLRLLLVSLVVRRRTEQKTVFLSFLCRCCSTKESLACVTKKEMKMRYFFFLLSFFLLLRQDLRGYEWPHVFKRSQRHKIGDRQGKNRVWFSNDNLPYPHYMNDSRLYQEC